MHKLLLDCDNTLGLFGREIDDGLALLYLLGCEQVNLLGITTTFGNGSIEQVHTQTAWLLDRLGHGDLPLHRGAAHREQSPTAAAEFLAATVAADPGEISILALGPLTNLWAAAQVNPAFFSHVKRIICMGGFTHPVRVGWHRMMELNFSADARAASVVLQAPCPVSVCNAHICFPLAFERCDLKQVDFTPAWLQTTLRRWLWVFGIYQGVPRFYMWDLVPSLLLTQPECFESESVRIDPAEENLRGGWLVASDQSNTEVEMPLRFHDVQRCKQMVFDAWRRALA